ncbi:hypothetical protein ACTXT7_011432 [Hymenolepis weldensis]
MAGYVRVDPIEVPTGPSVNADTDAYVETFRSIVKPPWIDSVANRGRPYVFHQDSASSHKALKIQDCMDGQEFSSTYHTELMAYSYLTGP